jgi:hypothetical protein
MLSFSERIEEHPRRERWKVHERAGRRAGGEKYRRTGPFPLDELCREHLVLADACGDDDIIAVLDLVVELLNHWAGQAA